MINVLSTGGQPTREATRRKGRREAEEREGAGVGAPAKLFLLLPGLIRVHVRPHGTATNFEPMGLGGRLAGVILHECGSASGLCIRHLAREGWEGGRQQGRDPPRHPAC